MRTLGKLSVGAALFGSVVLFLSFAGSAQAYDNWDHDHDRIERERIDHDRWERDHDRHYWDHRRFVEERPVIIHERPPMVVERPVYMAPQPVYQAPSAPSGLNLNFNIPLN